MRSAAAKAGRFTAAVALMVLAGVTACGQPGGGTTGPGGAPTGTASPAGSQGGGAPASDGPGGGDHGDGGGNGGGGGGNPASYSQGGDPVKPVPQPATDTEKPETTGVGVTPSPGFPTTGSSCNETPGDEAGCPDTDSPSPTDDSSTGPTAGGAERQKGQTGRSPQPDTARPGPTRPASSTP